MTGWKRGSSKRRVKRFVEKKKKVKTRSKFEDKLKQVLDKSKVEYEYEPKNKRVEYTVPAKNRKYLPDFVIGNRYYEAKGYIRDLETRMKYVYVAEQNPDIELIMVFQKPNLPIRKGSKTTYKDWFEKKGIRSIDFKQFEKEVRDFKKC